MGCHSWTLNLSHLDVLRSVVQQLVTLLTRMDAVLLKCLQFRQYEVPAFVWAQLG